jgi:hypothetical protein
VNIHCVKELILGNTWITMHYIPSNSGMCWKCWNNYPWILFQESAWLVGPNNVNIRPESTACCCVCWTSASVWTGVKYVDS